jgi:hypothetical protein
LLFGKKLALEAVIGVLGVLLLARFGGGVVAARLSSSAEGTGKDEILLLKGVPSGSRFRGGSLMGCRFFLLLLWGIKGALSTSPDPTVSPLRCRVVLALFGLSVFVGSSPNASMCEILVTSRGFVSTACCGDSWDAGVFTEDAAKEKVVRSGSFGDSNAFGIAGTGGTSSSSSAPAELWTFLGLGVGRREPDKAGFPRFKMEEVAILKEFKLEFDDRDTPEAYDLRLPCSGVSRADDGVTLFLKIIAGD